MSPASNRVLSNNNNNKNNNVKISTPSLKTNHSNKMKKAVQKIQAMNASDEEMQNKKKQAAISDKDKSTNLNRKMSNSVLETNKSKKLIKDIIGDIVPKIRKSKMDSVEPNNLKYTATNEFKSSKNTGKQNTVSQATKQDVKNFKTSENQRNNEIVDKDVKESQSGTTDVTETQTSNGSGKSVSFSDKTESEQIENDDSIESSPEDNDEEDDDDDDDDEEDEDEEDEDDEEEDDEDEEDEDDEENGYDEDDDDDNEDEEDENDTSTEEKTDTSAKTSEDDLIDVLTNRSNLKVQSNSTAAVIKSNDIKFINIKKGKKVTQNTNGGDSLDTLQQNIVTYKTQPKKSFSMRLISAPSYSMKLNTSNYGPTERDMKNFKTSKNLNMSKISLQLMDLNKNLKMLKKKSTVSFSMRKNKIDKLSIAGPFLAPKKENEKIIRKPGYVPPFIKNKKNTSIQFNKADLEKKMKLIRKDNPNTFTVFQNMIILDTKGEIYTWDGYEWNYLYIPCEHFISLYTNHFGHVMCIDENYECGNITNNKRFKVCKFGGSFSFIKIIYNTYGKLWGINLTGDLLKWNNCEWVQIKKAYGISRLKSMSFDRNNDLWILDANNYFYVYDDKQKNWSLKNVIGTNVKDFDFNELNNMIAITHEGTIKILKSNKWISYGLLGQKDISQIHFLRERRSNKNLMNQNDK